MYVSNMRKELQTIKFFLSRFIYLIVVSYFHLSIGKPRPKFGPKEKLPRVSEGAHALSGSTVIKMVVLSELYFKMESDNLR